MANAERYGHDAGSWASGTTRDTERRSPAVKLEPTPWPLKLLLLGGWIVIALMFITVIWEALE